MPDNPLRRRYRLAALLLAGALGLAACGGDSQTVTAPASESNSPGAGSDGTAPDAGSGSGSGDEQPAPTDEGGAGSDEAGAGAAPVADDPTTRPELPVADASAASPLPVVTVRDVTAGRWVQFADFAPSDKPTVYWFWAPH